MRMGRCGRVVGVGEQEVVGHGSHPPKGKSWDGADRNPGLQ